MSEHRVASHYDVADLVSVVTAALAAAGKTPPLTVEDLAPLDAFHTRGRGATEELAEWVSLSATDRVIDVGCGLGGTSRYLAARFGCRVDGIDLADSYCATAERLSELTELSALTTFHVASALDIPFPRESFDVAWTEHVQMNVADKRVFYAEILRVLTPGGRLIFNDIFAGSAGAPQLPVPWASEPSISHLASAEAIRDLLVELGAEPVRWEDRSDAAIAFFRRVVERANAWRDGKAGKAGSAGIGLHLLMGASMREKLENMLRNLEEDRVRVVQSVFHKTP